MLSRAFAVPVNHSGLPHTPVGAASVTETNGMLEVSGINSSGSNGVAIALGGGRGWRGDFGTPLTLMDGDGIDGSAKFDPNQFAEVVTKISAPARRATAIAARPTPPVPE